MLGAAFAVLTLLVVLVGYVAIRGEVPNEDSARPGRFAELPTPTTSPTPAPAAPSTAPPSTSPPRPPVNPAPAETAAPEAAPARYVFPVDGGADYGRTHALYPASDIFAPCGTTVRAAVDGEVVEISWEDTFDPANPQGDAKGGKSVSIIGDDGVRYYGSHLSEIRADLTAGMRVAAGDRIGTVGKTGNANNVCHLHFAISPACLRVGDWWIRRGVIYPWSYLDAWRAGEKRSPIDEVNSWQATNGCPASP